MQTHSRHTANRQGFTQICCLLAQVTSSQDLMQASSAAAWQRREGGNGRQFSATTIKGYLAHDKELSIQVQIASTPFYRTHILKLERYRKDQLGFCARMICKFVKRSKFLVISSEDADTRSSYCQQVGLHVQQWFTRYNLSQQTADSHSALRIDTMARVCLYGDLILLKISNASRISVLSLCRVHANLLCIVPVLLYVLLQQRLSHIPRPGWINPCHQQGSLCFWWQ